MGGRRGNPRNQCTICRHAERGRAELLLAAGRTFAAVARKFGMSDDALNRHWRAHVTAEQRAALVLGGQALAAQEGLALQVAESGASVLDNYQATRAGLWQRYIVELREGNSTVAAILATQITRINDSIARLTGELSQSPLITHQHLHVNFTQDPEFVALMQDVAEALGPYPEARRAVFERFERSEAASAATVPQLLEHQTNGQDTQ